jgi:Ferritin-like
VLSLRDTINDLMNVPEEKCDLEWLKKSLKAAIKLEFSTLPPYLCALWSIVQPRDDSGKETYVAESVRKQIATEEMLHMGLTCNLLVSLGEPPTLNSSDGVPTYPDRLPGNVNPSLIVSLQGLSKESLLDFLKIEQPQFDPIASPDFTFGLTESHENDSIYPTIGDFYDYVLSTFKRLNPTLQEDKQIEFFSSFDINIPEDIKISSTILKNLQDVESAIQIIKKQGEGSMISPADDGATKSRDDLAHYYRFAEIYKGKKLILVDEQWRFGDEDIPFPEVFPMAKVPPGGYKADQVREDVKDSVSKALKDFDEAFTLMMNQLQEAWTTNPSALGAAVGTMFSLRAPAQQLMSIPILADGSTGNFGPCFRLILTS